MRKLFTVIVSVSSVIWSTAFAATEINEIELRQAVEELSASTLDGGKGWKTYNQLLHPEYSRWAMGEVYEGRTKFVKSLEEWWNYGMRVAERDIEIVAVNMVGNLAIIRYKTTESFVGPDGPTAGFTGYVSNTWIEEDGNWLLLFAELYSTALAD